MNIYELIGIVFGSGGVLVTLIGSFFTWLYKKSEKKTNDELQQIKNNTSGIATLELKLDEEIKRIQYTLDNYALNLDTTFKINKILFKNELKRELKLYLNKEFVTSLEREHINQMAEIYLNKLELKTDTDIITLINEVNKLEIRG